jgi:hypothetical protein
VRACEAVFDMETSEKVQALIEEATGSPCPCIGGLPCPLVSERVRFVPTLCIERGRRPASAKVQATRPVSI